MVDAGSPESGLALWLLSKLEIKVVVALADTSDISKQIMEELPNVQVILTHDGNTLNKALEISNNLGFDLILDFGGRFSNDKRQFIQLLSFLGRVVTTCNDLQLDPPESQILYQLSA